MENKFLILSMLVAMCLFMYWIHSVVTRDYIIKIDKADLVLFETIIDNQKSILKKLDKKPSSDCDPDIEMDVGK